MPQKHGTHTSYANGCRCTSCQSAHATYRREHNRRERTLSHGKASTYKNYGCRCPACREAQRIDQATYQAKRRAKAT